MGENIKPLSLKEGKVYIDGVQIMDAATFTVVYTPSVWEGKALGDKGTNRRWLGRDITGTITEYRTTPWLKEKIMEYEKNGTTPEMTIQGTRVDKDSDYYSINGGGSETVTVTGAVITGDIGLMSFDVDGDVVKDSISFGAKNII